MTAPGGAAGARGQAIWVREMAGAESHAAEEYHRARSTAANKNSVLFCQSSTSCWPLGSRKLETPRPSSRSGRDTSFSRPNRKHPSR